ncbi:hypothetical protein [Alkalilimnicola sp. S0819]|uniref:hypothetical protein n=1 Tax=Alkalilimnicola sp. S0819 TaxID=2613922 RepID=UPI0012623869|nr:hypothetical protein [Alkalilimnicola sp. S0819]KAB7627462.1 hypothetical protein F3N43_03065 [Alkalilimnicola sp. S0819]MPQ15611.1 hypothetical protein [Alkalilimnicola sp. S0819]
MIVLLFATTLTACAAQPRLFDDWRISGALDLAHSDVRIFINGEQVVHGPLRGQDSPPLPFSSPAVFPLRGEYRGHSISVACGQLPYTADPYCRVYVDGQMAKMLSFYLQEAE